MYIFQYLKTHKNKHIIIYFFFYIIYFLQLTKEVTIFSHSHRALACFPFPRIHVSMVPSQHTCPFSLLFNMLHLAQNNSHFHQQAGGRWQLTSQ